MYNPMKGLALPVTVKQLDVNNVQQTNFGSELNAIKTALLSSTETKIQIYALKKLTQIYLECSNIQTIINSNIVYTICKQLYADEDCTHDVLLNRLACILFILERKPTKVHLDTFIISQLVQHLLHLTRTTQNRFVFEVSVYTVGIVLETGCEQCVRLVRESDMFQSIHTKLTNNLFRGAAFASIKDMVTGFLTRAAKAQNLLNKDNITGFCEVTRVLLASSNAIKASNVLQIVLPMLHTDEMMLSRALSVQGLVPQLLSNIQFYHDPETLTELTKSLKVFGALLCAVKTTEQMQEILVKAAHLPAMLVQLLYDHDQTLALTFEVCALLKTFSLWCKPVPEIVTNVLQSGALLQLLAYVRNSQPAQISTQNRAQLHHSVFSVLLHAPSADIEMFVTEGVIPMLVSVLGAETSLSAAGTIALALRCVDRMTTVDPAVTNCMRLCAKRAELIGEYGGWECVNLLTYSTNEEVQEVATRICMKRYPRNLRN